MGCFFLNISWPYVRRSGGLVIERARAPQSSRKKAFVTLPAYVETGTNS